MAFGGSRWTKDIALSAIESAVAVGAKLVGARSSSQISERALQAVDDWVVTPTMSTPLLIVIACSVVLLGVCKIVPETFQRLVGGASLASGSALIAAAGMVGAQCGISRVSAGAGYGAACNQCGSPRRFADGGKGRRRESGTRLR